MKNTLSELIGMGKWNKEDKILVLIVLVMNITLISFAVLLYTEGIS